MHLLRYFDLLAFVGAHTDTTFRRYYLPIRDSVLFSCRCCLRDSGGGLQHHIGDLVSFCCIFKSDLPCGSCKPCANEPEEELGFSSARLTPSILIICFCVMWILCNRWLPPSGNNLVTCRYLTSFSFSRGIDHFSL
jgi:hypothetical protein